MMSEVHENSEPRIYRVVVGAVGGQGGGAISEILFQAVRIERLLYSGSAVKGVSYEKRSMTPGLAQRSGSTVTSLSFIDPRISVDQLPSSLILSEMPHRASCDVVIAQEMNELMKYIDRCKPDGWILTNETRTITPPEKMPDYISTTDLQSQIKAAKAYIQHGTYVGIDSIKILRDNNMDSRTLNVIMMGILHASNVLPISKESYLKALAMRFSGKIYDMNIVAFELGELYFKQGKYKERDPDFSWSDYTLEELKVRSITTALQYNRKRQQRKITEYMENCFEDVESLYSGNVLRYVIEGLGQMISFDGISHGKWYLRLVEEIFRSDNEPYNLTEEYARNLAGRIMQWDGPYRIAQYVMYENLPESNGNQIIIMEKKLQPTLEEIIGMLPIPYFLYNRIPIFMKKWYHRNKHRGKPRDIRTTSIFGFSFFWLIYKLRWVRRFSIRYKRETALISRIHQDIKYFLEKDHEVALNLAWYIGKIRGYAHIRSNHIYVYEKLVTGIKSILEILNTTEPAVSFIKNVYMQIGKDAMDLSILDTLLEDHLKGRHIIPLMLPE